MLLFPFLNSLSPEMLYLVIGLAIICCVVLGIFTYRLYVSKHRDMVIGRSAEVIEWNDKNKRVKLIGELWNARAIEPMMREPGDTVTVVGIDSFTLSLLVADAVDNEPSLNTDNPASISKG